MMTSCVRWGGIGSQDRSEAELHYSVEKRLTDVYFIILFFICSLILISVLGIISTVYKVRHFFLNTVLCASFHRVFGYCPSQLPNEKWNSIQVNS